VSPIASDDSHPSAARGPHTSAQATAPRKRHRRRWLWLAIALAVVGLFYGGVGYWASCLMIGENPRWRGMNRGPQEFGLISETVSLSATDGVPIKAWWLPAPAPARATVIIAPGGDHTRQAMLPRAVFLVHGGYNVLAIDLRGHGESGGQFISPGLVERRDLLGAIRYVRSRGERGPIALLGVCVGGVASLFAAAESPDVDAVIADSAFPSGYDVFCNVRDYFVHGPAGSRGQTGIANGRSPWGRVMFGTMYLPGVVPSVVLVYYLRTGVWLGLDLVSVLPAASRISCPVLIVSGEADWIVPPADARKIFAAIPGTRKTLISIPHASHDGTYSAAPELYRNAVLGFLDSSLKRPLP
jgi:alpha-beta hydrolase superfamily lysophospholipase